MDKATNDLIFVYGTLLLQNNRYAGFLRTNANFIANGTFSGQLFDLGNYPGAVFNPDANELVYGSIFKMFNPASTLHQLDIYEGIEEPNCEYKREVIAIKTASSAFYCWVYLYALEYASMKKIDGGDYVRYLELEKRFY